MQNELYHYGVRGMKWGVRRYQNADGTLTEAGKKHQRKQVVNDVRDIMRNTYKPHNDPNRIGYFESKNRIKSIPEVSALSNAGELKSIKAEKDALEKPLRKIVKDFHNDKGLEEKYLNKQKKIDPSAHGDEYLHLYLKDIGFDYNEYSSKHGQLFDKYSATCKELTSGMLNKYGDKPLLSMNERRKLGNGAYYEKRTVGHMVESALRDGWFNEDETHWFY